MNAQEAKEVMATSICSEEEILEALEILAGAALMKGNRRLYEHIYGAKVRYDSGAWLNGIGPCT